MPATRPDEKTPLPDERGPELARRVLLALGSPPALLLVKAHHLWESRFRVNVLVGQNAACACVAHSYFVEAGDDGTVLQAFPPLMRRYA
ncbi:MAG: hypothetical protein K2W96_09840 [Gemmataceae bacterium]|nr:hypothetical protein [Gemmataceae bacterium]